MSDRLTREEIKRDELADSLGRIMRFISDNRNTLIAILVALVLIVVGSLIWGAVQSSRQEAAAVDLADAMEVFNAPVLTEGADPEADPPTFGDDAARRLRAKEMFTALRDKYGSQGAGGVAAVHLGSLALQEGDSATARELWESYLSADEGSMLAGQVRLNLLSLDRADGKLEDVAASLQAMLDSTAPQIPEDVLLFELGSVLEELGRGEDALEKYQRIIDEYPRSPMVQPAQRKSNALSGAAAVS